MLALILFLQVVTLGVAVYAARKAFWAARIASGVAEKVGMVSEKTTQQIEALDWLYRRLDLERGTLPPTRGWAASPDFLTIVYDHVRDAPARTVLECGSGITTIVIARALEQRGGGMLISLEHDPDYAKETAARLRELGLEAFVTICVAPLVPTAIDGAHYSWYDLSSVTLPDQLGVIVVDGPPLPLAGEEGRYPAGPKLFERLAETGVVLLDDTSRPGEQRVLERLVRELPFLTRIDLRAEKGCVKLVRS